jgi:hypothetical protein
MRWLCHRAVDLETIPGNVKHSFAWGSIRPLDNKTERIHPADARRVRRPSWTGSQRIGTRTEADRANPRRRLAHLRLATLSPAAGAMPHSTFNLSATRCVGSRSRSAVSWMYPPDDVALRQGVVEQSLQRVGRQVGALGDRGERPPQVVRGDGDAGRGGDLPEGELRLFQVLRLKSCSRTRTPPGPAPRARPRDRRRGRTSAAPACALPSSAPPGSGTSAT